MEKKINKILVIDDIEDNIITIKMVLKKENYHVISANNGYDGIELAKKEMPDAIILDIMMPGIDGFDTCRKIKGNPLTKEIPVMFLSSKFQDIKSKVKGLDIGADDYLIKPFDNLELLARVRVLIRLKNALEEVAQKNRYYLEMLGFISHELKNPLTSIVGVTETFKSLYKEEISEDHQKMLEILERNTEYIKVMIERYLNLSKIERGELQVNIQVVKVLIDIINPIILRLNPIAYKSNKKIVLSDTKGFEDLSILTDKNFIEIVFSNLLSNAIKYSYDNSEIIVVLHKDDKYINISVKNKGEPLSDENATKLFKRFSRIKTFNNRKIKGTGLGLFNSKYLIEKINGYINYKSEADTVIFTFGFPFNDYLEECIFTEQVKSGILNKGIADL